MRKAFRLNEQDELKWSDLMVEYAFSSDIDLFRFLLTNNWYSKNTAEASPVIEEVDIEEWGRRESMERKARLQATRFGKDPQEFLKTVPEEEFVKVDYANLECDPENSFIANELEGYVD